MGVLTVFLEKATKLKDGDFIGKSDPYVKLHVRQNNTVWDKEQISTTKEDDLNPVFEETFHFNIPTLDNMELLVQVRDSDINFDEKLGNCAVRLDELGLSPDPTPVSRKVYGGIFGGESHVHLALAYDAEGGPETYASSAVGFWDRMDSGLEELQGAAVDATGDVVEFVDDKVGDMPIVVDIKAMKAAGCAVYSSSRETSSLCLATVDKATEVVAFGLELKETLEGMSEDGTLDASKFEVILDLVDGDRVREATALAEELGDLALQCVDKSQDMIEAIELGIDSLPDFIEDCIEDKLGRAAEKGAKEGDPDLPDVETHTRELKSLVTDVENVNLFTVMSSGKLAFDGLRSKGEVCQEMFATVRGFSEDVSTVSDAIQNFDLKALGMMKDMAMDAWRCLRLSSLIKLFSEGVGEIIRWIVSLFKKASKKLGSIWGALARAKDVLGECVRDVVECMRLCDDAKDRSGELCDLSHEIREHLLNIVTLDRDAIASIKDLSDGDEIRRAIQLATTMDDTAKECVGHILVTIKKVCGAIKSLPDVLTEGVDEVRGEGEVEKIRADRDDDDPPTDGVDVSGDIEELDGMRGAIEEANVFKSVEKSADGFDGVKAKIGLCGDMLTRSRGFADTCNEAIVMFGGVWDVESAQNHMLKLFEIVSLGKLIRHFAQEIMKLVRANIALMKSVVNKFKDIDFVPDKLEDFVDDVGDGLKDMGNKLAFWKK